MTTVLTDRQRSDAQYVESLVTPGRRLRLDLSDERQYRHAVDMHNLVGQTADVYPGLHKGLAQAREAHIAAGGPPPLDGPDDDGFETGGVINTASTLPGTQTAASEGFSSILGGAWTLSNSLFVKDASQNVLAQGGGSQYGDGTYLQVVTDAATAKPIAAGAKACLLYTYQQETGSPPISEYVIRDVPQDAIADPIVTQPTHIRSPGKAVRIGLGRGPSQEEREKEDVDYWFWQGKDDLTYAVPLVGSATFNGKVSSVEVEGSLARGGSTPLPDPGPKGGVLPIEPEQAAKLAQECTMNEEKLEWSFPWADTEAACHPITFIPAPWDTSEVTYFTIYFTVSLASQLEPVVVSVVSSEDQDEDSQNGVAFIPPIEFVFHCLAEGTRIALADGSTAAIEDLTAKHALRGAGGESLPVVSTVLGNHRGTVRRLTVDAERQLVLSHNHLVLTPAGPRRAGELAEGDEVLVEDGVARLAAVSEERFEGLLCNASLSLPDVDADASRNSMIANGIRVGDYELQVQTARAQRRDPERILAHLDEMYHEDYRNHIATEAARAAS